MDHNMENIIFDFISISLKMHIPCCFLIYELIKLSIYSLLYKGEFRCLYSPLSSWVPWLSSHPQLLVSVMCTWALTLSRLIAFAFYFITTMKVPILNSRLGLPFTETKTKTKTKKQTSGKWCYEDDIWGCKHYSLQILSRTLSLYFIFLFYK